MRCVIPHALNIKMSLLSLLVLSGGKNWARKRVVRSFGSRRSPSTMMSDGKGYEHRNEEKDRLKEARKIKNLTRKESSE